MGLNENRTKKIKKDLIIYQAKNGAIEFRGDFDNDNFILRSLNQLVELFGRDESVISRHIKNIFKSGEFVKNSVVAKLQQLLIMGVIE